MAGFAFTISLKDALSSPAKSAASAITALTSKLAGVAKLLNTVVPGLGDAAAAIIGIGGAIAGATVGLVAAGMQMSLDAAQFKAQTLAAFQDVTGTAEGAQRILAIIDDLKNKLPESQAVLVNRAKQLLAEGLDPSKLAETLTALSSAAARGGDQAAAAMQAAITTSLAKGKFTISARQLKTIGVTEAELAQAMGMTPAAFEAAVKHGAIGAQRGIDALNKLVAAKGANSLAAKMNSLPVIIAKAKENFSDLFRDVNVTPFINGLKSLLSIFDASTASGKVLHAAITSAFNAIFAAAAKVFPYVKHAIMEVIIIGLKLAIYLKQNPELWAKIVTVAKLVGQGLLFIAAAIGAVIGFVLVGTAVVIAFGAAMFAMSVKAVEAVGELVGKGLAMLQDFVAGAEAAASNFVSGLVNGLRNGTGMLVEAIKALGHAAVSALKAELGIASPSKVTMAMGAHTGRGFAEGIRSQSTGVRHAANDNAAAVTSGMAAPRARDMAGGGKHGAVTVGNVTITITGAGEPGAELTEQGIVQLFERLALASGL